MWSTMHSHHMHGCQCNYWMLNFWYSYRWYRWCTSSHRSFWDIAHQQTLPPSTNRFRPSQTCSSHVFLKKKQYGTMQHPSNKLQHQLNFIFVSGKDFTRFTNAKSYHFCQFIDRDRRVVKCRLRFAPHMRKKRDEHTFDTSNVIVIPQITCECKSVVEAVCSLVLITTVESNKSKPPPLVAVAYISSNKLRFSSVRVRYGT